MNFLNEIGREGSASSPYIIENYIIDATSSHGISIQNITKNLIIRECDIQDGFDNGKFGIYLSNSSNILIHDNHFTSNYYAVMLFKSTIINITNNVISQAGIYFNDSNECSLSYNEFNRANSATGGVWLQNSDNNLIQFNEIKDLEYRKGICLFDSHYNILNANKISNIYMEHAIDIRRSHSNIITSNQINKSVWISAIYLHESQKAHIENNYIYENGGMGILLYYSDFFNITGNIIRFNLDSGICVDHTMESSLTFNLVTDNDGFGIHLLSFINLFLEGNEGIIGYGDDIPPETDPIITSDSSTITPPSTSTSSSNTSSSSISQSIEESRPSWVELFLIFTTFFVIFILISLVSSKKDQSNENLNNQEVEELEYSLDKTVENNNMENWEIESIFNDNVSDSPIIEELEPRNRIETKLLSPELDIKANIQPQISSDHEIHISTQKHLLGNFKDILNEKRKIEIPILASLLNISEKELLLNLVSWSRIIPFKIENGIIEMEILSNFIGLLDKQFQDWTKKGPNDKKMEK